MSITGETFKSALSSKLKATYPAAVIYTDKTPQGAVRPYYTITSLDTSQRQVGKSKYLRLYQLKVSYFPPFNTTDTYNLLDNMGCSLLEILKTVDIEAGDAENAVLGAVKSYVSDYKIVEDVLQAFFNYQLRVKEQLPTVQKMNTLQLEVESK